jgi:hypothetical protein
MVIEYEGVKYQFDLEDIDILQALKIEQHIGGPMLEFEQGMFKGRAVCVQVLGWLVLHRGDTDVPIASVNFKYPRLMTAFATAVEAQQAAEAAGPDPTAAAASNGRKRAPVSSPSM